MSEVKRYEPSMEMHEESGGEFVAYDDYAALQQKLDAEHVIAIWHTGEPAIPEGASKRYWVTHRLKAGSVHVTDLTFFNCPEPDEESDDCEMYTPDGEPYWPVGWHDLCSHPDFDYYYTKSDLDVLAYAEYIKPTPAEVNSSTDKDVE